LWENNELANLWRYLRGGGRGLCLGERNNHQTLLGLDNPSQSALAFQDLSVINRRDEECNSTLVPIYPSKRLFLEL
jgi:hypothetical protein